MVRGASAEALAELGDQLGTRTLADSATLGEELLGVAPGAARRGGAAPGRHRRGGRG